MSLTREGIKHTHTHTHTHTYIQRQLNPGHKDNDQRTGRRERERTIILVIQRELKEKHRWKETRRYRGSNERKYWQEQKYIHSSDKYRFMIY